MDRVAGNTPERDRIVDRFIPYVSRDRSDAVIGAAAYAGIDQYRRAEYRECELSRHTSRWHHIEYRYKKVGVGHRIAIGVRRFVHSNRCIWRTTTGGVCEQLLTSALRGRVRVSDDSRRKRHLGVAARRPST